MQSPITDSSAPKEIPTFWSKLDPRRLLNIRKNSKKSEPNNTSALAEPPYKGINESERSVPTVDKTANVNPKSVLDKMSKAAGKFFKRSDVEKKVVPKTKFVLIRYTYARFAVCAVVVILAQLITFLPLFGIGWILSVLAGVVLIVVVISCPMYEDSSSQSMAE